MKKIILKTGAILGILQVFIQVLQYFLSVDLLNPPWEFSAINFAVIISFIVFAIKRAYLFEEVPSIKTALKVAVGISVVASIFVGIYHSIFMQYIEPNYIELMLEEMGEKLSEEGLSDEKIELSIAITKKMLTPFISIPMGIIFSCFGGVVIGLISGSILKRTKQ